MDRTELCARDRLLARFGVSSEAEDVWRLLISEPQIDRANAIERTHLADADLDHAITELVDAFLVRAGAAPLGVVTIDPQLALESRLAAAEREMAEQAEAFSALRMLIPGLSSDFSRGRVGACDPPMLEVVEPLLDIQRQIDLAASRVTAEIRALDHAPTPISNTANSAAQKEVLARGVHDRAIIPPDALGRPGVFEDLLDLQGRGHDARSHPAVNTRLIIYDRDLAVLPIAADAMDRGAFFIRQRSVIAAFVTMYDAMWQAATPIFSAAIDGAPVGRHARILELLALGYKDEAISRALNIGVRTIRRDVAELKELLGVSSRAEIVAAAVRRGWL
jgi:DNA-binding CsgD family transcriptional regulator